MTVRINAAGDQSLRDTCQSKVAVVTGAASGIGFALSRLLATNGATVVMLDRDAATVQAASDNVSGRTYAYECDISSWEQQRYVFQCIIERFLRLDIVCLNAGIDPELQSLNGQRCADEVAHNWLADEMAPVEHHSSATWKSSKSSRRPFLEGLKAPSMDVFNVNLQGTIYGLKLAVHHMKLLGAHSRRVDTKTDPPSASYPRRIIITGSAAAYNGFPGQDLYSASKHALLGLVRAVSGRPEVKEAGIAISMVCPWLTRTPLVADIPSSHMTGAKASEPEDVAGAFGLLLAGAGDDAAGKIVAVQGIDVRELEDSVC